MAPQCCLEDKGTLYKFISHISKTALDLYVLRLILNNRISLRLLFSLFFTPFYVGLCHLGVSDDHT